MDKAEMIEKAKKQLKATDTVVKNQKAELIVLEETFECLELGVASVKKCVMIAVETAIDLQTVIEWLENQE